MFTKRQTLKTRRVIPAKIQSLGVALLVLATAPRALAQGNGAAGIQEATAQVTSYFEPATTLIYAIGAVVGLVAAWFRRLDSLLMRMMDALLAFPAILLAIGISAALGATVGSVIAALASAYVPRCARIVRASALVIRELDYVDAARVSGAGAPH